MKPDDTMTLIPTLEQQVIVDHHKNMVAIAKPGSGKTFVMSEKIRAILPTLCNHQGIIAISYTNKASDELKKRSLHNGIRKKLSFFGTIDRFCSSEIIFSFLPQLWGQPEEEFVVSRIRDLDPDKQEHFSEIEENHISLEEIENHIELLKSYFQRGILLLETSGALALYTLTNSKACQKYIQSRYTHIFVDEYQDSGLEQHDLFLKLEKIGLVAIAVGDADQSIFAFSNKDSKYLMALAQKDNFKLFPITLNHRCHPSIINYSQQILSDNPVLQETDEIRVYEKKCVGSQDSIGKWINDCLPQVIEKFEIEKLCNIGVLVRQSLSGRIVHESLTAKHRFFESHPLESDFGLWSNLFCQLLKYYCGFPITAQEIIETSSMKLTPQEIRIARKAIVNIKKIEQDDLSISLICIAKMLLPNSESKESKQLLKKSLEGDIFHFFSPPKDDEIQIMTIHKAKGLEFDVVFHLDLYEWSFPSKMPGPGTDFDNPVYPSIEQDINLHYVAVTRSKKACILCTSTKRIKKKWQSEELEVKSGSPSEFLTRKSLIKLRKKLITK